MAFHASVGRPLPSHPSLTMIPSGKNSSSTVLPPHSPNDPACPNLWQRRENQLGFGTCLVAVASLAYMELHTLNGDTKTENEFLQCRSRPLGFIQSFPGRTKDLANSKLAGGPLLE